MLVVVLYARGVELFLTAGNQLFFEEDGVEVAFLVDVFVALVGGLGEVAAVAAGDG